MRRPCREVQRYITSGASEPPAALEAHIAQCAKCQRAWRLEQAYQRSLHTVRGEPVPACDLLWVQIQARLTEQTAERRAPVWRRYAYAGSFAVALLAASFAWFARAPQTDDPALVATLPPVIREGLAFSPEEPDAAMPATKQAMGPATPQQVASAPAKPQLPRPERTEVRAARPQQVANDSTSNAVSQSKSTRQDRPYLSGGQLGTDAEQAPIVASLPLSQYELYNNVQVEYLPIRYGTPSSDSYNEGNQKDAIICSF